MNALLMWSGGIDSTYLLWRMMTEGKRIRVHHVHLDSFQKRREAEAKAVDRMLGWFKANGLDNFEYTESHFGWGTLPYKVRDVHIWAFIVGCIAAREPNITTVLQPWRADERPISEVRRGDPVMKLIRRIYREIPYQVCGRYIEQAEPCLDKTREDFMREMPRELLEMCWWCRTPKNGRPCHTCETCPTVDALIAKLGIKMPH